MSRFGWSLPPGCGMLPGEEDDGICEVCGREVLGSRSEVGSCECPECDRCGEAGNIQCYSMRGCAMELSDDVVEARREVIEGWRLNCDGES